MIDIAVLYQMSLILLCVIILYVTPAATPRPWTGRLIFFSFLWSRLSLFLLCQVLHSLSVELSQYLPLLLKLVVVVYAVLCLGELLHRWSSGGRCSLSLVRLSSQQQRCSAVQYWVPTGGWWCKRRALLLLLPHQAKHCHFQAPRSRCQVRFAFLFAQSTLVDFWAPFCVKNWLFFHMVDLRTARMMSLLNQKVLEMILCSTFPCMMITSVASWCCSIE